MTAAQKFMAEDDDLRLLTLKEATEMLRVSDQTLRRMLARDELPTVIVGARRRMIRVSAIREYLGRKESR